MRKRVSRRAVVVGAGTIGLLAAGGVSTWHVLTDAQAMLGAMIRARLRDITVADGTIDAFTAEFVRHFRIPASGVAIGNVCDALGIDRTAEACVSNAAYLTRLEERVIDLFVRSTDLLAPDRRDGEPIRYAAFWDPYSGACRNLLADFSHEA